MTAWWATINIVFLLIFLVKKKKKNVKKKKKKNLFFQVRTLRVLIFLSSQYSSLLLDICILIFHDFSIWLLLDIFERSPLFFFFFNLKKIEIEKKRNHKSFHPSIPHLFRPALIKKKGLKKKCVKKKKNYSLNDILGFGMNWAVCMVLFNVLVQTVNSPSIPNVSMIQLAF